MRARFVVLLGAIAVLSACDKSTPVSPATTADDVVDLIPDYAVSPAASIDAAGIGGSLLPDALKLTAEQNHKFERAWKVASLVNNFGRKAIVVLSGHGVGADTAARILRNYIDEEQVYKSIYEAERQYVITRGFWAD